MWCSLSYKPARLCEDHTGEFPHYDVLSDLGSEDEPQTSGALVLVWAGDYRRHEVWVASGANIGNWYCLGNEFLRPKVWDPPRQDVWDRSPQLPRPAGTIPTQPDWSHVLGRGPVMLLSTGRGDAYREGVAQRPAEPGRADRDAGRGGSGRGRFRRRRGCRRVTEGSLIGTNCDEPMGDAMSEPTCTDETANDENAAVDSDEDQPESGAPVDDEQETAVDAFVAGDEDDASDEASDDGTPAEAKLDGDE
jgi:hypothetical protein